MGPLGASVRALRPHCGHPDADFAPVAQRASRFEAVSAALRRSGVSAALCTEEKLSHLVSALRAFLDRRFGRFSDPAGRQGLTVLPDLFFRDYSEFGPLSCILRAVFRYARDKGIGEFDFDDEEREEECVQVVFSVEKALKKEHHLRLPKVFITPLVEKEEEETMRDILQTHGATIVSHPTVATHVIYPDPEGRREQQTDGQVLVRVLERASFDGDPYCFLHWFHHPDSYDDWVPDSEVLGHVYVPRHRKEREQWHVQARWVRDLELHNEFMNELDYEMPSTFTEFVGESPSRATVNSDGKPFVTRLRLRLRMPDHDENEKRLRREAEAARRVGLPSISEDPAETMNGDVHGGTDDQTMVDVENLSTEGMPGAPGEGQVKQAGTGAAGLQAGEKTDQTAKIPVGNGIFLPHFAGWFSLRAVHDIERRALPEFFEGRFPSKNERTYREIRNFIVETWRKTPKEYLSGTAARRHLAGDACCILRTHGFLEHWGLINYDCSSEGAPPPSFVPPPRPLPLHAGFERDDSARIGPQLVLDSGSRLKVKNGKVVKYGRNDEILESGRTEAVLIRDTDRNGNPTPIAEAPEREPIEYHCDSCGIDCSQLRFHCATKADVDLCASCYQSAKYASTMKPRDFIQMNSAGVQGNADDADLDVWTESETLLLLEALELYGDNWTLVSEHVGSKGKGQCVIQFLRLPIEDAFLTRTAKSWWNVEPTGGVDDVSPVEMMRRAGARESALTAINAKGSAAKMFSGQPLVFGDQISTIVPFAGMLSSLSPPEILKEVTCVMGVGPSRKRPRDSFVSLVEALRTTDGKDAKQMPEAALGTKTTGEDLLSSRVYDELRKRVPPPGKLLRTDQGERVARSALSLINHGAIPVQEIPKLHYNTSPRTLLQKTSAHSSEAPRGDQGAQTEEIPNGKSKPPDAAPGSNLSPGGSALEVGAACDTSPRTLLQQRSERDASRGNQGDLADGMANGKRKPPNAAPGSNMVPGGGALEVDAASSTAVAIASLAAACATASSRQQLEEAEVDRLHALVVELRLERIRRKTAQLAAMSAHEEFARAYKKRRFGADISSRVARAAGMLRGLSEEILAEGGPAWVDGRHDSAVRPLLMRPKSVATGSETVGEGIRVSTLREGHVAEIAHAVLPDFSEEVALQHIRGVRADGEVVAEEEEEILKPVVTSSPDRDVVMAT